MIGLEEILDGRVRRLGLAFERLAHAFRDLPAVGDGSRDLSYAQLAREVSDWAHKLQEAGLRPGDRCAVVMENCATAVSLFCAIQRLDAWPILVNARSTLAEIGWIVEHSQPRLVLCVARDSVASRTHAQAMGADRVLPWGVLSTAPRQVEPEPVFADGAKQTGALIYTSGSTGKPKGVMLSHRSLLFIASIVARERGYQPGDRVYGLAPLSHSLGQGGILLPVLHSGAHYLAVRAFEPGHFLQLALAHEITVFNAPPAAYHRLMAYVDDQKIDVSRTRLRILGVGSAPLDPLLKRRVEEAFRLPLHNGYGITETGPTVAFSRPENPAPELSIGPPLPYVDVKVVDSAGRDVPSGAEGELWIRGPGIMLGYYKDARASEAAFRPGGWFASGDVVSLDAAGNLHVRGRLKELIIRSGFNVYPAEIENVLNNEDSVAASAVIGRTVEGNEEIIAFIEPRPGHQPSIAQLQVRLRQQLAPYKQPSRIILVERLPKTSTGKVLKHALEVPS